MIAQNTDPVIQYVGNGSADTFAITFPVFESANIIAQIVDSNGVYTDLVLTTDYTLSNINRPGTNPSLTLVNAAQAWLDVDGDLATGYTLIIRFNYVAFQPSSFKNLGRYSPETLEKALDRICMALLSVNDVAQRAFTLPDGDNNDPQFPALAGNDDKILQVNSDGTGFTFGPTATAIFAAETNAIAQAAAALASATAADNSADAAAASEIAAGLAQVAAELAETNAETARDSALASEQQAELFASLSQYSGITVINFAASPYTVGVGEQDTLFLVDCTGGAITINLPDIGTTPVAWKVGFIKTDNSANGFTLDPAVGDTINTAATLTIDDLGIGATVYAESPTDWNGSIFVNAIASGSGGGLDTRVSALEANDVIQDADIAALQGDVTTLQGDVTTLQGDLAALDAEVTALQALDTGVSSHATSFTAVGGRTHLVTAALAVTLPVPAAGLKTTVRNTGAFAVTVDPNGAELINGQAFGITMDEDESLTFISDGTNWFTIQGIVGNNPTFTNVSASDVSTGTLNASSGIVSQDAVQLTTYLYLGDPTVNGTWRLWVDSGSLKIDVRTAGNWVNKDSIGP